MNNKLYRIRPEYYDLWGAYEGNDIVSYDTITELAHDWEKPIAELMTQVEEI